MANKSFISRITTGLLNTVNDSGAGGNNTSSSAGLAPGQVGDEIVLNAAQALALSDTTVGTLYEGTYKYVQFYVSQSGTTVKGGPVYWQDPDNFVVTADVPTGFLGFAGVAISVPTKGNFAWIQIEGKANCLPLDNTTKGTPAIGDIMVCATIGRFDDVDDPYASAALAGAVAGQWIVAPADATSTLRLAYIRFATRVGSPV